MTSTFLIGGTGLVGSHILSTLLSLPTINKVYSLGRRTRQAESAKLESIVEPDTTKWAAKLSSTTPPPSIFFSALGTTSAQAGSVEKQRLIDYDLNLEVATAARDSGVKVCVLISTASSNKTSWMAYAKMKGELEEAVAGLGFETAVIVKPGLLVGKREVSKAPDAIVGGLARFLGAVSGGALKDSWAQDADVIGRAAVSAGLKALNGDFTEKVVFVEQADVLRLGKKEWKA